MLQQVRVLNQVMALVIGIDQVEVVQGMEQVEVLGMEWVVEMGIEWVKVVYKRVEVVEGIEQVEVVLGEQVVAAAHIGEVEHHIHVVEKHDDDVQVVEEEDGKAQEQ